MHHLISLVLLTYTFIPLQAQIGIGQWRDHLPYQNGKHITASDNYIYCATDNSLFSIDREEKSIERYSKVNKLSGTDLSDIAYHKPTESLLIVYRDANIDILHKGKIINLSDVLRSDIIGNKTINKITFEGNFAYLSCGFGILLLDMVKREIRETYFIRAGTPPDIQDAATFQGNLYAASTTGIYKASLQSPNLADFAAWTKMTELDSMSHYNHLEAFGDKLILNKTDGTFGTDTLYRFDGSVWAEWNRPKSNTHGLKAHEGVLTISENYNVDAFNEEFEEVNHFYIYENPQPRDAIKLGNLLWVADLHRGAILTWNDYDFELFNPGGPKTTATHAIDLQNGALWTIPGSVNTAWGNTYTPPLINRHYEEEWSSYDPQNFPILNGTYDLLAVAADPNSPERAAIGSWGHGMLLLNNDSSTWYNQTNSTLSGNPGIQIGGLAYDESGNLWITNANTQTQLNLLTSEGTWHAFTIPGSSAEIGQPIITSLGHLWAPLPRGRGLAAYDPGLELTDPSDDHSIVLSTQFKKGGLPTTDVHSVAEDHDGEIWVGTSKGIAVFSAPASVFTDNIQDAQPIKVQQDNTTQLLLEAETVTSIAIDGANRKWLGTSNGGVFLMSPDGKQQIHHFTSENSPLLSNSLQDITIDHQTGEVFFATAKGLVSYKGTATAGTNKFENVYAYPNPVRPEYSGPIAIKGLYRNAACKITDTAGNLVYSTNAEGGQVVWNGRRLDGLDAGPGVYLVFATNNDGSSVLVTKILMIR